MTDNRKMSLTPPPNAEPRSMNPTATVNSKIPSNSSVPPSVMVDLKDSTCLVSNGVTPVKKCSPNPKAKPHGPLSKEEDIIPEDVSKKKLRRVERILVPVIEKLDGVLSPEKTPYHRLLKLMAEIIIPIDEIEAFESDDKEDESDIPTELLISKSQLSDICSETGKLKALGAMASLPTEKLLKLLLQLGKNIQHSCKSFRLEEGKKFKELIDDSMSRGVISSLTALHILTSNNMPKRIYQEDVIVQVITFTRLHFTKTIFPSYDPIYRVEKADVPVPPPVSNKRTQARPLVQTNLVPFYHKLRQVIGLLAELVKIQPLTDSSVFNLSTLGISPFFVENVSELQLSALKLVTSIFTNYDKHRSIVLNDILASISRLPSNKRNLRMFKLSPKSDHKIQMMTALVLRLIQCVTYLPDKLALPSPLYQPQKDALVNEKFQMAEKVAGYFLKTFWSKCSERSDHCDYRPLFENFLQDLLLTVNKPEWPAAELLLVGIGNILASNLGNKNIPTATRVASLDFLGVAAARLRKDSVSSREKLQTLDDIIEDIITEEENSPSFSESGKVDFQSELEKTEVLQRFLLDYLAVHGLTDPALLHARHFFITTWWNGAEADVTRSFKVHENPTSKKRPRTNSSSEEEDGGDENEDEIAQLTIKRKTYLLNKIPQFSSSLKKTQIVQTFVDPQNAELVAQYLASKRPFSASFDVFLTKILCTTMDPGIQIRSKALKCLTIIIEADNTVLARKDMEKWVQSSFSDNAPSVREAAVDLIGKYILACPHLIEKYYDSLAVRILDTSVSVRKRVIKILSDISSGHPNFSKIPDIYLRIMKRVNDPEEGIRKLVFELFQKLWFTPVSKNPSDGESMLGKVSQMMAVIKAGGGISGLDCFEQLLSCLFKPEEDKYHRKAVNLDPPQGILTASQQILDSVKEQLLLNDELGNSSSSPEERFSQCISIFLLFAKIRPQLLINHVILLQGYFSLQSENPMECEAIANIAKIIQLVAPSLVNPSEKFLAELEEQCYARIFQSDRRLMEACMGCLGSLVNNLTHNYPLIRNGFVKFYTSLKEIIQIMRENPANLSLCPNKTKTLRWAGRAVFTIGLFLRHFDFTRPAFHGYQCNLVKEVFIELVYLLTCPFPELRILSLQAIGNMCLRQYKFMLEEDLKYVYKSLLLSGVKNMRIQVLQNIHLYLTQDLLRMVREEAVRKKSVKQDDIKKMGNIVSGMGSTIVQIYLKEILATFLDSDVNTRMNVVEVVKVILQQALVNPTQIIPYLICMSADNDPSIATAGEIQIKELQKKHPQLLQNQILPGVQLSLRLHQILGKHSEESFRGYRCRSPQEEIPTALNSFIYSLISSSKSHRRAVILSLLKMFDSHPRMQLGVLLFYADTLAYLPYKVVDEPLFIIYHLDIIISVMGSNILQSFKESLSPLNNPKELDESKSNPNLVEDDDEEDVESLLERIPAVTTSIEEIMKESQGCMMLLMLKRHLKAMYGLSDSRINGYSETNMMKGNERPVNRKPCGKFDPKLTGPSDGSTPKGRLALVEQYLRFKEVMNLDPVDDFVHEQDEEGMGKHDKIETLVKKPHAAVSRFPKETKKLGRQAQKKVCQGKAKKCSEAKKRKRRHVNSDEDSEACTDPDFTL